jgi:hypothetical protein
MAGLTDDIDSGEDGFAGPAVLRLDGACPIDIAVEVTLRGYFEPVDGRYHWYGRLAANDDLTELVGAGKAAVRLSTEHGSAKAVVSDLDPWGRLRIAGVSTPPFPIVTTLSADPDLDPIASSG